MRITINNYDNATLNEVSQIIKFIDEAELNKFKHYNITLTGMQFNEFSVYFRKTTKGVAIDIHKL